MATPSSVLAWRIPGTEEPGGLPGGVTQSRTRLKRLQQQQQQQRVGKWELRIGMGWEKWGDSRVFPCLSSLSGVSIRDSVFSISPTQPFFCGSSFCQATLTWCSNPSRPLRLLRSVNTSSFVLLALRQYCFLMRLISVFHHCPLLSFSAYPHFYN